MMIYRASDKQYYSIKRYVPYRARKNIRFIDYLYIIISFLIVIGIAQKIEINKLKKLATVVLSKEIKITPAPKIKYIEREDPRVIRLQNFLRSKSSPLLPYAKIIVEQSDKHGIDYTIMVSISGMESSFGKNTNQSCHNPFGLGGTKMICFPTWESAILFEAKLLDRDYRINIANGIQSKYCPPEECNPQWSETIVGFSKEIIEGGEK